MYEAKNKSRSITAPTGIAQVMKSISHNRLVIPRLACPPQPKADKCGGIGESYPKRHLAEFHGVPIYFCFPIGDSISQLKADAWVERSIIRANNVCFSYLSAY